jgi:hypothetical protein
MSVMREHWDNLSDDVCYINPDATIQGQADEHVKSRQKKETDMTPIEKEAWKSAEHCAHVCSSQDVADEEDDEGWVMQVKTAARDASEADPADANDTEKSEDSAPSDATLREQRKKAMNDAKKSRTCFQYRYHNQQCCVAKSFKLGAPKAKSQEAKTKWVSGWDLKGINDWISAMGECKNVQWKTPEL